MPMMTPPGGSGSRRLARIEVDRVVAHQPDRHDLRARRRPRDGSSAGRLADTSTLPTSTDSIFSTLPTLTPDTRTGERALEVRSRSRTGSRDGVVRRQPTARSATSSRR